MDTPSEQQHHSSMLSPSKLSSPSTSTSRSSPLPSQSYNYSTPSSSQSPSSYSHNRLNPSLSFPNTAHRWKKPIKSALRESKHIPSSASAANQYQYQSSPSTPTSRSYSYSTPTHNSNNTHNNHNNQRHNNNNNDNTQDDIDDDIAWRKDGKELRKKLLEEDDADGGSEFVINRQCKLRNYCAIADRVSCVSWEG